MCFAHILKIDGKQHKLQVGQYISKTQVRSCGIPQGSELGPHPFFLHFNDISYSSNQLNFFPFVDDTNPLYAEKNLSSLEVTASKELAIVCNWLIANIIPQHKENKLNFVIFRP